MVDYAAAEQGKKLIKSISSPEYVLWYAAAKQLQSFLKSFVPHAVDRDRPNYQVLA
jgi:hypothetical protein